jgi:hypothetical protein
MFREQTIIYENLIDRLSGNYDRSHLVDYFNIDLCSYHFRQSISNLLYSGKPAYLWSYISAESRVFWPKWKRLIVSLPYAINEKGRMNTLVKMAGEMMVANK